MNDLDIDDENLVSDEEADDAWELKSAAAVQRDTMASRRRIEDLKERQRMRELLEDYEFELDYS
jgi:hypothetical protein